MKYSTKYILLLLLMLLLVVSTIGLIPDQILIYLGCAAYGGFLGYIPQLLLGEDIDHTNTYRG